MKFDQIFLIRHLPSFFLLMKSASFVFWKEVEMWEWINYFISPLKIQNNHWTSARICKRCSLQSLFSLFRIPDLRAVECLVPQLFSSWAKFWKKQTVLNLCFSHLMRWEILGRPPKHFWCTGIWSLWNLAVSSVTVLAEFCLVLSCIVLSLCYIFIADNTDGTKRSQWNPTFFFEVQKKWKFTWKTLKLLKYPLKYNVRIRMSQRSLGTFY